MKIRDGKNITTIHIQVWEVKETIKEQRCFGTIIDISDKFGILIIRSVGHLKMLPKLPQYKSCKVCYC